MKTLGNMFSEEDKKKAHPVKEGEGADDKKYIDMMHKYKSMRRDPKKREEAVKLLKKAHDLAKKGDVSSNAL